MKEARNDGMEENERIKKEGTRVKNGKEIKK
jgi:hypothetical protein